MRDDLSSQLELPLARSGNIVQIPIEMVRSKKSAGAAFTLACDASGLDDKEIYMHADLEIDAGYFSNIKKGKATLQSDKLAAFCAIVKNTVYPEWLAYQVGCTLVVVKTEAERRAEAAEDRARKAEDENRLLRQLVVGKVPA